MQPPLTAVHFQNVFLAPRRNSTHETGAAPFHSARGDDLANTFFAECREKGVQGHVGGRFGRQGKEVGLGGGRAVDSPHRGFTFSSNNLQPLRGRWPGTQTIGWCGPSLAPWVRQEAVKSGCEARLPRWQNTCLLVLGVC